MKIIVIGSRAYNELVGRIEKIEAAIASLPEKGRAWNKEYITTNGWTASRSAVTWVSAGVPFNASARIT